MSDLSQTSTANPPLSSTPPTTWPTLLGVGFCLMLIAWMFFGTIAETIAICWNDEDYSHGLLLPLVSGFLIYERRAQIHRALLEQSAPTLSWTGVLALAFGLVIYCLGELADIHFIRWFAFFPSVLGVLFLLLGPRRSSDLIAPLLLLFMAKPLPDALVPKLFFPLQVFAAKVGAWALDALHVPVYLRGNIIEIPGMELMVEQACSGLRSLLALLTVASIVILIVPLSRWSQALILFTAVGVAILLNVARVTLTGLLAHFYDPDSATGFFHAFSGMIVFLIGLVIVYGLASVLQQKGPPATELKTAR